MINKTYSDVYSLQNYNGTRFIFVPGSNTLFEYSDLLNETVQLLSENSKEVVCSQLGQKYSPELVRNQVEIFQQWTTKINDQRQKTFARYNNISRDDWVSGKALTSLWMNISHDCNLRCVYCYGGGGAYGGGRKLMTIETAKRIIDYWYDRVDKSAAELKVVFFGGEPLMNKKVLLFAVQYINSLLGEQTKVSYTMTTNGTIMDEELLRLLVSNDFHLTLSIDGSKEIQDKDRPFASGKGSFDQVKKTLDRLNQIKKPITARLTLVHEHVSKLADSIQCLWDMGVTNITFDMVSSKDERLNLTQEDLAIIQPQLERMAQATYEHMVNRRRRYLGTLTKYAKAMHNHQLNSCIFYSKNSLMVDPDGEIHKCHRMIEDSDIYYGNIFTDIHWEKYNNTKKEATPCSTCWARNLCVNCPQINQVYQDDIDEPYELSCALNRMIIKENLKLYATLYEEHPQLLKVVYGAM